MAALLGIPLSAVRSSNRWRAQISASLKAIHTAKSQYKPAFAAFNSASLLSALAATPTIESCNACHHNTIPRHQFPRWAPLLPSVSAWLAPVDIVANSSTALPSPLAHQSPRNRHLMRPSALSCRNDKRRPKRRRGAWKRSKCCNCWKDILGEMKTV